MMPIITVTKLNYSKKLGGYEFIAEATIVCGKIFIGSSQ
jgi:hypothetical protein